MKLTSSSFTSNGEAISGNMSADRTVGEPSNGARRLHSSRIGEPLRRNERRESSPTKTSVLGDVENCVPFWCQSDENFHQVHDSTPSYFFSDTYVDNATTVYGTGTGAQHTRIRDDFKNLSETTQQAVDVTESATNERTISAQHVPGSDMGYANTIRSRSRSPQDASTKMERTQSLHSTNSEPKEQGSGDSHSVDAIRGGVMSGLSMGPQSPGTPEGVRPASEGEALSGRTFGTPSTISTAPSTDADEASADGTDSIGFDPTTWRLDDPVSVSVLPPRNTFQSIPARESAVARMPSPEQHLFYHRRTRSWEAQQRDQHAHGPGWEDNQVAHYGPELGSHANRDGSWDHVGSPQTRVASFRTNTGVPVGHGYSHAAPHHESWRQSGEPHHGHQKRLDSGSGSGYQQASYGAFPGQRNLGYGQLAAMGSHTPPRPKQRSPLHTPTSRSPPTPSGSSGGLNPSITPRSSSEILKTLLRKKACLYEPDTSRAVAYVTWLVGRELALEYGYFSRQQLQSGVHACVADKIDCGTITRTKVNRCMQIILNSCFHYIIPRPDGSEENGDAFREIFAATAVDDSKGLQSLPAPWDNLMVEKGFVLAAASREGSPANSPRMGSQQSTTLDDVQSKRAVLLCFNENVRSAADVFRCHNEFIRDTANASNLQLSAQEWRAFFGKDIAIKTTSAWGSAGMSTAVAKAEGDAMKRPDVLGRMSADELSRFRTTWCTKRYDHDHDLCAFAHVEANGGWLRRSSLTQQYRAEMCPSVVGVADKMISPYSFFMNRCEKGTECEFAHSNEEILYHPDRYKHKLCSFSSTRGSTCPLGDICPNFHTSDTVAQGKRRVSPERRSFTSPQRPSGYRQSHGHGYGTHADSKGMAGMLPEGSPMLYVSPAPVSSFEKHLGAPGLQNLFRRHSSVISGYLRHGETCKCCYTNFGDDWGISAPGPSIATWPQREQPSLPSRSL